jgi:hypothetical protein
VIEYQRSPPGHGSITVMGLFGRRRNETDFQWVELALTGWHDFQMMDMRASKGDVELGARWAEQVAGLSNAQANSALAECDPYLREVIPAVEGLPYVPDDANELVPDFVQGWVVAELEEQHGMAREGGQSIAALTALCFLREGSSDAAEVARGNLLEAGYFARRSGQAPRQVVASLTAGASR